MSGKKEARSIDGVTFGGREPKIAAKLSDLHKMISEAADSNGMLGDTRTERALLDSNDLLMTVYDSLKRAGLFHVKSMS